jgi:hypothetical protein
MKIAKSIGRDIANTYSKLEKLTLLAKRQTIFDDKPQEIEELTRIIKEDMNALVRDSSSCYLSSVLMSKCVYRIVKLDNFNRLLGANRAS